MTIILLIILLATTGHAAERATTPAASVSMLLEEAGYTDVKFLEPDPQAAEAGIQIEWHIEQVEGRYLIIPNTALDSIRPLANASVEACAEISMAGETDKRPVVEIPGGWIESIVVTCHNESDRLITYLTGKFDPGGLKWVIFHVGETDEVLEIGQAVEQTLMNRPWPNDP